METGKPARSRRRRQQKPENYYKILGIRSNASPQLVKQKYIEAVKAFPPENHPQEFERIRRAYETLRDPKKRREYDLMFKYGGKLEKIFEQAWKYIGSGRFDKAEILVKDTLQSIPEARDLRLILAEIALLREDLETFRAEWGILEAGADPEDRPLMLAVKARLLLETEFSEEALEVLDEARTRYPDRLYLYLDYYKRAYLDLERDKDLWNFALSLLPPAGTETPADIRVLLYWLEIMFELEQWQVKSSIQQRIRKFLKTITNAEDKGGVLEYMQGEHDGYLNAGRFREAEMIIDFMYYLDSTNPAVREQRKQTQELMRLEKEIQKMNRDEAIFPMLGINAVEWLFRDYWTFDEMQDYLDNIPDFLLEPAGVNPDFDKQCAAGIITMRRKYPLVYRRFQDQWDELYAERVQFLNREARRQVKFGSMGR